LTITSAIDGGRKNAAFQSEAVDGRLRHRPPGGETFDSTAGLHSDAGAWAWSGLTGSARAGEAGSPPAGDAGSTPREASMRSSRAPGAARRAPTRLGFAPPLDDAMDRRSSFAGATTRARACNARVQLRASIVCVRAPARQHRNPHQKLALRWALRGCNGARNCERLSVVRPCPTPYCASAEHLAESHIMKGKL
jgi:hypothetical protein